MHNITASSPSTSDKYTANVRVLYCLHTYCPAQINVTRQPQHQLSRPTESSTQLAVERQQHHQPASLKPLLIEISFLALVLHDFMTLALMLLTLSCDALSKKPGGEAALM
jgi:hypothetical protein